MAFRYQQLQDAVATLKKSMLPIAANDEIIETIMALHHAFKNVDGKQGYKVFTTIIPRINHHASNSADLKFALRSLQKAYDSEVKGVQKFKSELDWFLNSEARLVVEIRTLLTKLDYEQLRRFLLLDSDRLLSVSGIVRANYFKQLENPFKSALGLSTQRVGALLKKYEEQVRLLKESGTIRLPHFWKLKGEITEMLCQQVKLDALAEIQKLHPNAQLIENVMAVTAKTREGEKTLARAPRQIWDGIIAVPTKNGLKILKIFEVKSGLKGFDEALEQVVQTHLNRFASMGDELHVTLGDGSRQIYKLGANGKNGVDMDGCINIMLHPSGESWMMPNQAFEDGEMKFITQLITLLKREISHFDVEALTMELLLNPKKFLP